MTFSTYIAWWEKPQNVVRPIRVPETEVKLHDQDTPYDTLASRLPSTLALHTLTNEQLLTVLCGFPDDIFGPEGSGKMSRFNSGQAYSDYDIGTLLMSMVMGMVSAGICCIAWSFDSLELSFVEVVLWRLFSLSFSFVILFAIVAIGNLLVTDYTDERIEEVLITIIIFTIMFHVASRIGLFILAFAALRNLPTAAYETIYWANLIPHI